MKSNGLLIIGLMVVQFIACGEIKNELCADIQSNKTGYSNFEGIEVYTNVENAINCSSKKTKPLFILFSGYGNSGIRRETFADKLFSNRRFRRLLADKFIPIVLYVDDDTKLKEMKISNRNGHEYKLRTIGNKNSDYQIRKLKSNSQPQLVILDHRGEKIISQIGYTENSSKYSNFLSDGYAKYRDLYIQ